MQIVSLNPSFSWVTGENLAKMPRWRSGRTRKGNKQIEERLSFEWFLTVKATFS